MIVSYYFLIYQLIGIYIWDSDGKRASQSEPPKKKTVAERLAELEQEKERNDLEQWRKEHEKDSEITGYINSYVEKYVVDNELQAKSQRRSSSVEDIQVTTNLRYKAAVALKSKFKQTTNLRVTYNYNSISLTYSELNEAEEQVKKKWEIEEKKMKVESLEEITKVIGGSKALENQEKSNVSKLLFCKQGSETDQLLHRM
jgi:hypothetical protein